jgi:DNA-binding transcriptional ArsR family regulator
VTPQQRSRPVRLLVEERRRRILELLARQERATVEELVARFRVSAVTIRGDLDALADAEATEAPATTIDRAGVLEDVTAENDEVAEPAPTGPNVLPGYAAMTIPQLRGRLRHLSVEELRALLDWETAHENRPPYVTMLSNRITTVTEG